MIRVLLAALVVSAPLAWSAAPAAAATDSTGQHQVHRTAAKRHAAPAQHRRVAHARRAHRAAQPG